MKDTRNTCSLPKTIAALILSALATELRTIAAQWRLHILYSRIGRAQGFRAPDVGAVRVQIRKLLTRGEIEAIPDLSSVYKVIVPYASLIASPVEVILHEGNPGAVLSHGTAIFYHRLTDEIPSSIHASHYPHPVARYPLGTTPDDWIDLPAPPKRKPDRINNRSIVWSQTKSEWDFGHTIGLIEGAPVYITDLERTLIDALRSPEKCGGTSEVFRAWKRARSELKLNRLIQYVDRFDQGLLRQRVGYLLEQLCVQHSILEQWAQLAQRGSSAKLIAGEAFSSTFSERWCLSINVPDAAVGELRE